MEALGAFPDGEWDSISRLLFAEDPDEGLNFESSIWFGGDEAQNALGVQGEIDESSFVSSDYLKYSSSFFNFSQETTCGSVFLPNQIQDTYCIGDHMIPNLSNLSGGAFDVSMLEGRSNCSIFFACPDNVPRDVNFDAGQAGTASPVPETGSQQLKRKSDSDLTEVRSQANDEKIHERAPNKRWRVIKDDCNKNVLVQSKKSQKLPMIAIKDAEDENSGHSTSPYSSEDDFNAFLENPYTKETAPHVNLKGKKTKAGKASTAESQSIYARKRREKINERLKVLQHLVPNGTKVDISTMLEEAVHYVKFLQVQIKLLGSDDLWMYASIAYNGMDMGLLQKMMISPTTS